MSNIGNGNKGRFSDRLKRMRYNRLYRNKKIKLEDGEIIYKNFLKVVAAIPLMVASHVIEDTTSNHKKELSDNDKNKNSSSKVKVVVNVEDNSKKKNNELSEKTDNDSRDIILEDKQVLLNNTYQINNGKADLLPSVKPIDEKKMADISKPDDANSQKIIGNDKLDVLEENDKLDDLNNINDKGEDTEEEIIKVDKGDDKLKQLEKKITNLVKKYFVKMVNELEIYESELYILSEIDNDEKTLNACKKNIDKVKKIIDKIDKLKDKYSKS